MFLSTAPEARPPSSGEVSFFLCWSSLILLYQPICQKLDKHGARQQLGTKSIQFSSQQKIFSKVKDTLKMLPWGDKVVHYLVEVDMPSKSFEGTEEEYRYMRMLREPKYVGNFPQIIQVHFLL